MAPLGGLPVRPVNDEERRRLAWDDLRQELITKGIAALEAELEPFMSDEERNRLLRRAAIFAELAKAAVPSTHGVGQGR